MMKFFLPLVLLLVLLCVSAAESKGKLGGNKDIEKIEELIGATKYDEAIAETRLLEKTRGNAADLRAYRALAFMYKGDNKNAQQEAESAAKIDAQNHEAHWVLANVYMSQGHREKATQEFQLSSKFSSTSRKCKPCLKNSAQLLKKLK